MRAVEKKITKEEFERYSSMTKGERNKILESDLPIEWLCGYGYYGHYLKSDGENFSIIYKIGDSCD